MRRMLMLFVAGAIAAAWATYTPTDVVAQPAPPTPKPKVRPDVTAWMQEKGIAKVGVHLSGQWKLDTELPADERAAQREAIADAQQELVSALAGTKYNVRSQSLIGPFLSLEVGADALAVLENSPLARDVYLEEMVLRPQ